MKNAWELLASDDVLEAMTLLGCDDKYIYGSASDFEKFKELCATFFMLEGSDVAEKLMKKISGALEKKVCFDHIRADNAIALWKEINVSLGAFYGETPIFEQSVENLCRTETKRAKANRVEKNKFINEFFDVNRAVDGIKSSSDSSLSQFCDMLIKSSNYKISVTLNDADFVRPNRYLADGVIKKISDDEKYNLSEYNLLLCQIICELIFADSSRILQLYLNSQSSFSAAKELINYLSMRKLRARIFLCVCSSNSPEDIKITCLLGGNGCFTTPVFIKKDTDTNDRTDTFLNSLYRVYPSGNVLVLE